jgi:ribosomal protein L37AE/L43A
MTKKLYVSVCPVCKAKKENNRKPEFRVCKKCKSKKGGGIV